MVACGSDTPATPAEEDGGGAGLDGSFGRDSSEPPDEPEPDGGVFRTPNADAGCPLKYAGPRNGIVAASVPRPNTTGGIPWESPEKGLTVDTMYARAVLDDDQQSELLRVTNYGFTIPPTASIKGIVVQLKRRGENKIVDGNIQLWLDGVPSDRPKFVASGWPTNIGTHHYGQEVDTWGNDLTPELVGKTGFGTEIWSKRRTDAGTGPIPGEVESLIMTVWYCD
jgi:hypothetical protein